MLGGLLLYRSEHTLKALRLWRDYMEAAPDELGTGAALVTAPPLPFVPEELWGQPVLGIFVCYAGSVEDGEAAMRPLRELCRPAADLVQPMPYTAVQALLDDAMPPGRLNYWKAENMAELSDAALEVFVERARGVTSPFTMLVLEAKGRAINKVGEHETAFGHRDAAYALYAFSVWEDAASSDVHIAWTREFSGAMAQFTIPGISLNFTNDQDEARVRSFFGGPEKYKRLVALKNTYDPENVFRLNHNIAPRPVR